MVLTRFNINAFVLDEDDCGDEYANFTEDVCNDGTYCYYEEVEKEIKKLKEDNAILQTRLNYLISLESHDVGLFSNMLKGEAEK